MAANKIQMRNIRKIANLYAKEIEKKGIRPSKILLYGSFAKGSEKAWSDIDFVVISSDFSKMKPLEKLEFLSLATKNIDAPIEAVGYTPSDIAKRSKDSVFWDEISRSSKLVYERK